MKRFAAILVLGLFPLLAPRAAGSTSAETSVDVEALRDSIRLLQQNVLELEQALDAQGKGSLIDWRVFRQPGSLKGLKSFVIILFLAAILLAALWTSFRHRRGKDAVAPSPSPATGMETEHRLVCSLADRIASMKMTLDKMDPSGKDYRPLMESITRMKDSLAAEGYEIVDLLGKPYDEGMKGTVSFKEDRSLEKGVRVITNVEKPQVNYRGEMIQPSRITVSQNTEV